MCVFMIYVEQVSRSKDSVRSWTKIGSFICIYTLVSPSVPEMESVCYAIGGILFEGVPSVEFIYLVFTRMPWVITVGDSGLLLCPLSVERY